MRVAVIGAHEDPGADHGLAPRKVVGTGVDPVTFRFSGGRSAN